MTRDEKIELWADFDILQDQRMGLIRQYLKIRRIAATELKQTTDPANEKYYVTEIAGCNDRIAKLLIL